MLSVVVNILLFVLVIGVLTFVHELGHFVAAKLVKAKVFEFALGFGPKLISKEYKGTLYSIRIFPLGGFVKILGDGDPGKEEVKKGDEQFNLSSKPKIQQIFVMLAGVTMNIFLAIIIYYVVLGSNGWKVMLGNEFEAFKPWGASIYKERDGDVVYSEVFDDGAAAQAKFPESGVIKSIGSIPVTYSYEVGEILEASKGFQAVLNICNEGTCSDYVVDVPYTGKIGILVNSNYWSVLSYEGKEFSSGFFHLANTIRLISVKFDDILDTARDTGDYSELSNSVSGPVGIYFVIDYFKSFGFITFLSIIADLSLSLAIVNILPIPALDGGRVFILMVEGILKKDLDEKIETAIINISFIFLIILVLFIMVKDIVNIDSIKSMFN